MEIKKPLSIFFLFLFLISIPKLTLGAGLVPCGGEGQDPCTLSDFFVLIINIINFIIWKITPSLFVLMLIIGAVMLLVSGGNPELQSKGKKILFAAVIGALIVYGGWLIIDTIVKAIGADWIQDWSNLPG